MVIVRLFVIGTAPKCLSYIPAVLALVLMLPGWESAQAQQQALRSPANATATTLSRDSLAVQALRAEPGKASIYKITFVTTDTLAADAEIVVTFPPAFDLSKLEIAGSSDINGGFKLERKDREVRLRRSGLGDKVPPGKKVSVQLGMVVNPASLAGLHEVGVQLRYSKQTSSIISKNQSVQFISPVK
jgi:hypothetical protein